MKRLALALLLCASCTFPDGSWIELRPGWTTSDGTSIGINGDQSRFTNEGIGDSYSFVLVLGVPIAPAMNRRVDWDWPPLPPRYDLVKHTDTAAAGPTIIVPGAGKQEPTKPEGTTLDDVLKGKREIESMSTEDKIWLLVYLVALLALAFGAVKVWKMLKAVEKTDG